MKKILLLIIVVLFLGACAPSEDGLYATKTLVAGQIYGTQTALAPTATITVTPTATFTPTDTPTPTETPTETFTPAPPTPTQDADGVERMLLCYKAAVIVESDMQAYLKMTGNAGKSLQDMVNGYYDLAQMRPRVTNFRYERSARVKSITEQVVGVTGGVKTILSVNQIHLSAQDCLHENVRWTILMANSEIDGGRLSGVGAFDMTKSLGRSIRSVSRELRTALLDVYGVDPTRLDEIAKPIWQNVVVRYGIDFPTYLSE
jgi:hypothetical protein